MFTINRVSLQDFKPFKGEHTFVFPEVPGLYQITGKNKYNPRMGPNGVGKSTLLDAIMWCLYGHTSRGLKASDVVSWGTKAARVKVNLVIGSGPVTVERSQSPNSLHLVLGDEQRRPVDQEAVTKALRVNADGFLASIMHCQFGSSFLQLTPAAKLNLFSDILELDVWLEKAKVANKLADEIQADIDHVEGQIAICTSQVEILTKDIADIEPKEKDFEFVRKAHIRDARRIIEKANDRSFELADLFEVCEKKLKQTSKNLEADDAKFDKYSETLSNLNTTIGRLDGELAAAYRAQKQLENMLRELPSAGTTCPQCRQPLDKSHLKAETKRLGAEIATQITLSSEIASNLDIKQTRKKAVFKELAEMKQTKLDLVNVRNKLTYTIQDHEHEQQRCSAQVSDQELEIKKLKAQGNPHTEFLEEKREAWRKLRKDKVKLIEKLNEVTAEHAAVHPWVAGFKKIRLFIIEQTLKALELEINNNLANLGMPDWAITLDVERENKSGGVTKGFSVFVHAPGKADPVRFEAWSGGETQRLCLAGDIGLSNLIMEQAGLEAKVEFYDEPSEHLSAEGLQDLAETLADRAEEQGKQIFLIDHHVIEFGRFTDVFRITRDKEGSHFPPTN